GEPAYPSKLLSLDLLRPFGLEKAEWFRTDSGTSYRLSKSDKPPCPAERHFYSPPSIRTALLNVNHQSWVIHRLPQRLPKAFRRAAMRCVGQSLCYRLMIRGSRDKENRTGPISQC